MLIYLFLAFLLTIVPVIGPYVRLVNTIIHEVSHMITAKLTGGRGYHITLNRDTSGMALTGSASWFSNLLTAYAGYTGSSLTALLLFYLLNQGHYQFVILFFLVLSLITAALWVRNLFGLLWTISFLSLLGFLVYKQADTAIIHVSYLLSSVILVQSVISAADILMISVKHPRQAGDAANLQRFTYIPAFFWGALFFAQSIYIAYKIIENYMII